jgi:dienelactone hydrolase
LTSTHPAWRPRPTRHETDAPVTTCEKLHRHLRQCRAFSTAEPVPRLEATLRMAQQCQPSTSVTGQSAAGGGATVDMAKSGPAVMAAAGKRKQQSNRLQAHVPSWSSRGALSHGVKMTRPCSVPRTARTTTTPRATRPVALTSQQGKRHLWQAKWVSFHLRHDDSIKKGAPYRLISYPFPLPLSLSYYRDRERGYFERDPSPRRKRAPSPPTDQGFEGWPLGRV